MSLEALSTLAAVVLALSLATERGVTSVKSLFPFLDRAWRAGENFRRLCVQLIALVIAMGLSFALLEGGALSTSSGGAQIHWSVLGLMASGGSAFWKDVVKMLGDLRTTRSTLLQEQQRGQREKVAAARFGHSAPAFGTTVGGLSHV